MKEVKLNNEPQYLTFDMFIEKGVTDKEALKWLHHYFYKWSGSDKFHLTKDAILKALVYDHKPSCWMDFVNKHFSDSGILVDIQKIYAFNYTNAVYKFHRIDESWYVINLTDSISFSHYNHKHNSLEQLIKCVLGQDHTVYEFGSQDEFLTWALIMTGKCESILRDDIDVLHRLSLSCNKDIWHCKDCSVR